MKTRYDRRQTVVQYVHVYQYGKMFLPPVQIKPRTRDTDWSSSLYKNRPVDRAALISRIHKLLCVHRLRRECNHKSKTRCPNQLHKALQAIIRTCFQHKISESVLYPVGELFYELFMCAENSCAIFSILKPDYSPNHVLYPGNMRDQMHTAFEYYLQHIANIRRGHNSSRVDLINREIDNYPGPYHLLPLTAALQKRDPALVLSLLKFGADPFLSISKSKFDSSDTLENENPTKQLIDDLNGLHMFKNTGFDEETRAKLNEQETKAWTCLAYLRRAVPSIPITSSTHIVTSVSDDSDITEEEAQSLVSIPMYSIHPNVAQLIDMDFFKLASLKQLCRCKIREELKSNFTKVPNVAKGISLLGLPNSLQSYLNLDMD